MDLVALEVRRGGSVRWYGGFGVLGFGELIVFPQISLSLFWSSSGGDITFLVSDLAVSPMFDLEMTQSFRF